MFLFSLKILAYHYSKSDVILASMVDSAVDLMAKVIMYVVEKNMNKHTETYPVGKRRLEPISILLISVLMIMAAVLVIWQNTSSLWSLFDHRLNNALTELDQALINDENIRHNFEIIQNYIESPTPKCNLWSAMSMAIVIICKFSLWIYCRRFNASPIVEALSEDHFNDTLSNIIALVAFIVATNDTLTGDNKNLVCIDQIGAIIVGIYIIYGWIKLAKKEISVLVGRVANQQELKEINRVCNEYNRRSRNNKEFKMTVDKVTAYHNGTNIIAEVDIILNKNTPLAIAHDICLGLQHQIERISWIERAYVHADDIPEPVNEIAHIK